MRKIILGLLLGFTLGTAISIAAAKVESVSSSANAIVGYGRYNATTIVPLNVTSDGKVVVQ